MKKLYILLFSAILIAGCGTDDLENLTTITSDVELSEVFEVRVDNASIPYSASINFDASQNDKFDRFGSKIDEIVISKITYEVIDNGNYQNPNQATIENATFDFKQSGGASINVASINNQEVAALLSNTNSMQFDQNALNAIAEEIKSSKQIDAQTSVELDQPVDFDLRVTIVMTVKGSVVN